VRISSLLRREPFGEILERTLAQFLSERFDGQWEVHWNVRSPFRGYKKTEQLWYCNPYINAIFVFDADPAIFEPVRSEFERSVIRWRRPIQRAYIYWATHLPTASWLASYQVSIMPPIPQAEQVLIIGGNHRLRVFDASNKQVYVLKKAGFDPRYMARELQVRSLDIDLPVPRIQEVAQDETWYCEEYICGTPINRLKDPEMVSIALEMALSALERLAQVTARTLEIQSYVEQIITRIVAQVDENDLLTPEQRTVINSWIGQSLHWLKRFYSTDETIETVWAHGDFHPANILMSDDRTRIWLIDWEYSTRRQASYDGLVYALKSRFPKGLSQRMSASLVDNTFWQQPVLSEGQRLSLSIRDKNCTRQVLLLFLLEELDLHLEENTIPSFFRLTPAFTDFLNELGPMTQVLLS